MRFVAEFPDMLLYEQTVWDYLVGRENMNLGASCRKAGMQKKFQVHLLTSDHEPSTN